MIFNGIQSDGNVEDALMMITVNTMVNNDDDDATDENAKDNDEKDDGDEVDPADVPGETKLPEHDFHPPSAGSVV